MAKKKLVFTVIEAEGEPFSLTTHHSERLSEHERNSEEMRSAAYVDLDEKHPLIHLMPAAGNFMKEKHKRYLKRLLGSDFRSKISDVVKNINIADTIAHESLHLTLKKIGEQKANYDYDTYRFKNNKKEIWEF